jgi:integrase
MPLYLEDDRMKAEQPREMFLSDDHIANIAAPITSPKGSARLLVQDTELPGFYLRVSSRTKRFAVLFRQHNTTLGTWPTLSANDARAVAFTLLRVIREPAVEEAGTPSLQSLLDEYLATKKRLKDRTKQDYRACLKRYWAAWLPRPVARLTPDEFRAHFNLIPSPAQANYTLRIIRALFRFYNAAHDANLANPVAKLLALDGAHQVRPRTRLIKDKEQGRWLDAVKAESRTVEDLFVALACTGLRSGEALGLTWDGVDFEEASILIPDTKNGAPHALPLGPRILEMLKRRHATAGAPARGRVFGINARNMRVAVARTVEVSGVRWSPHDLRRGFVTLAVRLEVPDRVVRRLVNHAEKDVTGKHYVGLDVEPLRPYIQRIEDAMFARWGDAVAE